MALYIIDRLVEAKDNEVADKFNFYILPSTNPDGYEFSRSSDRMWRKTTSLSSESNPGCKGVDLNRNFGFHFGGLQSILSNIELL